MRLLLDVNVLVAIFDESHVHHAAAMALIEKPKIQIATCALTENGVLRVMNLPSYGEYGAAGFEAITKKLSLLCSDKDHQYFSCDVSLKDKALINWARVTGHNQITDVYLLALAVANRSALATFDQRVAISAVHGAKPTNLYLL
jgi:uncharacterized protein